MAEIHFGSFKECKNPILDNCEAYSEAAAEGGSEAIGVASFSNTGVSLRIFEFHILRQRFPVGSRFDGYYAYDKDRETGFITKIGKPGLSDKILRNISLGQFSQQNL